MANENYFDVNVNHLDDKSDIVDTTPQDYQADGINLALMVKFGKASVEETTPGAGDGVEGSDPEKCIERLAKFKVNTKIGNLLNGSDLLVDGYATASEQLAAAKEMAAIIQYFSADGVQSITCTVATETEFDAPAMPASGTPSGISFKYRVIGQGDNAGQSRDVYQVIPHMIDRTGGRNFMLAVAEAAEAMRLKIRLFGANDVVKFLGTSSHKGAQR
jgi:hypothetical protein